MERNIVVLFDAMGVLFTVGDDTNDLLVPFIKEKAPKVSTETIVEFYMKASLGAITSLEFWNGVGLAKMYPYIETEYLFTKLRINRDIYRILPFIYPKYHLAILSNDISEWSAILRNKYLLNQYFKSFISGDLRLRKPDSKIYEYALQVLGTTPENCVFIDDREKNLSPAEDLGMKVIHYIGSSSRYCRQ